MPAFRFQNPLIIGTALLSGIVGGRLLHASGQEEERKNPESTRSHPSSEKQDASALRQAARPPVDPAANRAHTAVPFVVPPDALHRIRLSLLEGTSLDRKECELLGLNESQIRELDLAVSSAVSRWREREKATMKIIASSDGDTLIHIPPADPALAEKEWQDLKASVLRIGGNELEPFLRYRLTDGYSPTFQSNAMTGMLNVLTAGYGTLERMVRIRPDRNGETTYEILDIFPDRRKEAAVDDAFFNQVKDSGSYQGLQHFQTEAVPEPLSHLLPAK